MPLKRQAVLTVQGPFDDTVTLTADFDRLTLTRTQVGGYRREPTGPTPITPEAAVAFWKQFEKLAAKGLRDGSCFMLDGSGWKFTACDGKKSHEATGFIEDCLMIDDEGKSDSYAELAALFDLLKP